MAVYIDADIHPDDLERFAAQLAREVEVHGGGPMHAALNAAGAIYMGYIRDRYERFSRGGGNWKPLAASTLKKRRKGRRSQGKKRTNQTLAILQARGVANAGNAAILRDTGVLFNSISNFRSEPIEAGVRVGTNVEYAAYHQHGGKHLPKREIFVQPDGGTLAQIERALEQGYQRSINELGGRA